MNLLNKFKITTSARFNREKTVSQTFPPGHFYSPVIDPDEIESMKDQIWPTDSNWIAGIDFNNTNHKHVLTELFPKYIQDYHYPDSSTDDECQFFNQNSQFSWLDSRAAFVLLREWSPSTIIEVGSGFSSLLIADINRRFWSSNCNFTCIEPYPREFLNNNIDGISGLIQNKVQNVSLDFFDQLSSNDVLFIDSSHVSKTGSDVNYLYFEVLPRLKKGVKIHIHDIFLPNDYPKDWVMDDKRSWNEQYLLRALLMYSTAFQVTFGCSYAYEKMPGLVKRSLADLEERSFGGGSLWIEKL